MQALDDVVSRHLGPGAMALPFSLSDAGRLEQLARAAGFSEVEVQQQDLSLRVSDPDSFAPTMLQGAAAVLPKFAELTPAERQDVIERMKADLAQAVRPFVRGDELLLDSSANILVARK